MAAVESRFRHYVRGSQWRETTKRKVVDCEECDEMTSHWRSTEDDGGGGTSVDRRIID